MNYFRHVTYNASPEVIGVSNGVYQVEFKENVLKKNKNYEELEEVLMVSFEKFMINQESIIDMPIKYLEGVLEKNAKLTDFMVFSPFLFGYIYMISQKVANCLKDIVSQKEYHLKSASIKDVNAVYYLLFIPNIPTSEFNFEEVLIYKDREASKGEKRYFTVNSAEEFKEFQAKNPLISFDRVGLPIKYADRNILHLPAAGKLFFSMKLIDSLQREKVTNFVVSDAKNEIVFSE